MGLYIQNMEMPKEGQMLIIFPDGTAYVCFNGMRERLAQAEAVSVQPHGKLGDLDKQDKQIEALIERHLHGYTKSTWDFVCQLRDILKRNRTIIPEDRIGDANQMVNNDYAGLKVKYIVRKASNGELVDDCFVLRPDKDQAAIAALNAYADATENQVLAADIRKWCSSIIPAEDSKLSATIKCGGAVTCKEYVDTARNLRWTGTHSGEHIIPAEEEKS